MPDDPTFTGETGNLPEVVARLGRWSGHDAYVAGPTAMVRDTAAAPAAAGLPTDHMHLEDFGWSES